MWQVKFAGSYSVNDSISSCFEFRPWHPWQLGHFPDRDEITEEVKVFRTENKYPENIYQQKVLLIHI